jgi:carboxypeptidase Q
MWRRLGLEYGDRTHHSNMDLHDCLEANNLEQAAAVEAWFVYNTAARPDMRGPIATHAFGTNRSAAELMQ